MAVKIFNDISVIKAPGCYDLVKMTFVTWSVGCVAQPKTTGEIETKKLLLAGPGGGAQRALMVNVGMSRQSTQSKRQDLGTGLHSVPGVECFGVPRLRPNWSLQTPNSRVVVSSVELLSEGHPGRQGRLFFDHEGCWGNPVRSFHLPVTLTQGSYLHEAERQCQVPTGGLAKRRGRRGSSTME